MWQKCSLVLLLIFFIIILDILLVFLEGGMYLKKKNTCNVYQKHLDLDKRIKIQKGIEENWTFTKIAKEINKSPRTVSYEILKNRICEHCNSWKLREKTCDKTSKPPYVCNRCPSRKGCRCTRYYYYAADAHAEYKRNLSECRKGIDMSSPDFNYLNKVVSNEIKNGHSFSMIIRNHGHEFPVGKRTLYNYVEKGYLDIINLDLPRKVRYKKRNKNTDVIKKDTKIRINRTLEDFKDYIKSFNDNNFNSNIVEMDTVEGIKGESVLLTLLWRESNFMLACKLLDKTSDAVSQFFCYLKTILGYETFHSLFPIILTDNGVEFSRPDIIEYNGKHVYPTKLFYCDPGHSEQKGKIEVNHEYIRRFIPKGESFDKYSSDDINLMLNHINSVKRDSLDGDNPYTLMKDFLPKKFIKFFDINEIEQKDIILNKKLFNTKKKNSSK